MSSHARSTRRKSNTAVEQIETDWKHAAVRPAPHVELPEWLLEETDKVAHRDYSTGFYYPEHKVTQNTDRSAYFRSWLVVGEVLSWSADEDGRVTLMSRNKIEPGQQVEFLLPGERPLVFTVPACAMPMARQYPPSIIRRTCSRCPARTRCPSTPPSARAPKSPPSKPNNLPLRPR
jgi:putative protease